MKLSVIVYASNNQDDLHKCIRTLNGQIGMEKGDVEILVIDDASRDRTPSIILNFEKELGILPFLKNVQTGFVSCVNEAHVHAKGKYLFVIRASDAVTHLRFFDIAVDELEKHKGASVFSGVTRMQNERSVSVGSEGMYAGRDGTTDNTFRSHFGLRESKLIDGKTFLDGFLSGKNELSQRASILRRSDLLKDKLINPKYNHLGMYFLCNIQGAKKAPIYSPNAFVIGKAPPNISLRETVMDYALAEGHMKKLASKGSVGAWAEWDIRARSMTVESEKPVVSQKPVFARQVKAFHTQ